MNQPFRFQVERVKGTLLCVIIDSTDSRIVGGVMERVDAQQVAANMNRAHVGLPLIANRPTCSDMESR